MRGVSTFIRPAVGGLVTQTGPGTVINPNSVEFGSSGAAIKKEFNTTEADAVRAAEEAGNTFGRKGMTPCINKISYN